MEDGRPKPEELDSLNQRVNDAKLRLDFASQYLKEVHADDRAGAIPSTDPGARVYATRAKREARDEYQRILKIYEEFIARGKAAHNGPGPKVQGANAVAQPYGEEP